MITLRDIQIDKIFRFNSRENSYKFTEKYNHPNNLVEVGVIYCDGSGWNRTTSAYCYGKASKLNLIITPENLTNNEAEYTAIIKAAISSDPYDILITDSLLAKNQIIGIFKCNKPHLRKLRDQARSIIKDKSLLIYWVERDYNIAGIHIDKAYKGLRIKNKN